MNDYYKYLKYKSKYNNSKKFKKGGADTNTVTDVSDEELMEYFPDLKDSVTYELFKEPVVISDGFTYEKEPLDTWLDTHNTSPMTNATLTNQQAFNNTNLKNVIEQGRNVVRRLKDCESENQIPDPDGHWKEYI